MHELAIGNLVNQFDTKGYKTIIQIATGKFT